MSKPKSVHLTKNRIIQRCRIDLPSSKSESNRALIINAFAKGKLYNLSEARDTQTMMRLLKSNAKELDVMDAGTTMRFLVAYCALTAQNKILTGTPRMCERPVGILVDALREIGANIQYLKNESFPPLETLGFSKQKSNEISVSGDVSSQYISAIMMLGPTLPEGLTIQLAGKVASRPYIMMTLELMKQFGAMVEFTHENKIIIQTSQYTAAEFAVESDWSGASYWFSFVALAQQSEVLLTGLKPDSLQGDHCIIEIMEPLGVKAKFVEKGLLLTKAASEKLLKYDFSNCPDLAQTVAVACAAKGIEGEFAGLESLRIKETDRIAALQNELAKIGASLEEVEGKLWKLHPAISMGKTDNIIIETYEDHRMAMAFAPLATKMHLTILDPSATDKSYPSFWKHVEKAGFRLNFEYSPAP
jgi:3-phosphoshikimate 1-carboxyvinyltransferase